eukprot:jgi/Botrbrau1/8540/Bobra.0359s0005.1
MHINLRNEDGQSPFPNTANHRFPTLPWNYNFNMYNMYGYAVAMMFLWLQWPTAFG